MQKIILPCTCDTIRGRAKAFAKIEFSKGGRLSISGVIGPTRGGNCKGGAGQCINEFRTGTPFGSWTKDMLQKFCDIWEKWHLNDMRPYCEHQKRLGWPELARKKVVLYHYRLTRDAMKKRQDAEDAALNALRAGISFTPDTKMVKFATLPYEIVVPEELNGEAVENYEPKKALYPGDQGATETKRLGWLREQEHPDGLLCKACPVCGYQYGTSWKKETVPEEVVDWLFSLPDTPIEPAWC